jgi:hypothetical protein
MGPQELLTNSHGTPRKWQGLGVSALLIKSDDFVVKLCGFGQGFGDRLGLPLISRLGPDGQRRGERKSEERRDQVTKGRVFK